MASTTEDQLYRRFLEVAGQQSTEMSDTRALLIDVIAQFQEVRASLPGVASGTQTQASKATTSTESKAAASGTDSGGSIAGTVASTIVKTGFGLAPLIAGLAGLFTGGEADAPPPLVKYAMPGGIQFQAAESNAKLGALDYDQMGLARSYSVLRADQSQKTPQGVDSQQGSVNADLAWSYSAPRAAQGQQAPQGVSANMDLARTYSLPRAAQGQQTPQGVASQHVTVNIQAMDARSFLDRSNDIALAVRDAMLNLNPINDVVNDL